MVTLLFDAKPPVVAALDDERLKGSKVSVWARSSADWMAEVSEPDSGGLVKAHTKGRVGVVTLLPPQECQRNEEEECDTANNTSYDGADWWSPF